MGVIIADKRYCLTADRMRVVAETDPDADTLLVGKGCELDASLAAKYGIPCEFSPTAESLIVRPAPIVDEPQTDALTAPPENKSIAAPQETK
jgi:hypothetical protein